jgi:membrane protein YqaA with SNARE-associated domain
MLKKEEKLFAKDKVFEYDKISKNVEGIVKIIFFSLILILIISQVSGLTKGTFIDSIISFIFNQFSGKTLLNVFFLGLIGGLFFLSVPIEILFINALHNVQIDSFIIGAIILIGLFLSYILDYLIGYFFSPLATKIMSPKQFYGIKVKLNKYGSWLILIFNLFPLPSQPLTFVCGVFKYNKLRYFSLWTIGWFIKIMILIIMFG